MATTPTPGYYIRTVGTDPATTVPTIDEVKGYNMQLLGPFTADPSTENLTTLVPHGQINGDVVMLTSTGNLPAPLLPLTLYRVINASAYVIIGYPSFPTTSNQTTETFTCGIPHGLAVNQPVYFYDSNPFGNDLPSPILPGSQYFVSGTGFTTTQFKVSNTLGGAVVNLTTNDGPGPYWPMAFMVTSAPTVFQLAPFSPWNPPPYPPPIDITSTGTGTHFLWICPLEYAATVTSNGTYVQSEGIGCARGPIYLGNGVRHQFKNLASFGAVVANADYLSSSFAHNPVTQWSVGVNPGSAGQADLMLTGYVAVSEQALGDLGSNIDEGYYLLSGGTEIIGGGPPGRGGELIGGGEPVIVELPRPTIKVRDPELASLIARARKAAQIIENLTIVGASGTSEDGFSL